MVQDAQGGGPSSFLEARQSPHFPTLKNGPLPGGLSHTDSEAPRVKIPSIRVPRGAARTPASSALQEGSFV